MSTCNWCGSYFNEGYRYDGNYFCSQKCIREWNISRGYEQSPEVEAQERAAQAAAAQAEKKRTDAEKERFRPDIERRVGHKVTLDHIVMNHRIQQYVAKEELDAEINAAIVQLEQESQFSFSRYYKGTPDADWDGAKKRWSIAAPFSASNGSGCWTTAKDVQPYKDFLAGSNPGKIAWYEWEIKNGKIVKIPKDRQSKNRALRSLFFLLILPAAVAAAYIFVPTVPLIASYVRTFQLVAAAFVAALIVFFTGQLRQRIVANTINSRLFHLLLTALVFTALAIAGMKLTGISPAFLVSAAGFAGGSVSPQKSLVFIIGTAAVLIVCLLMQKRASYLTATRKLITALIVLIIVFAVMRYLGITISAAIGVIRGKLGNL
jgi:uncharacterized Zn finger protein (UPF0148 family)